MKGDAKHIPHVETGAYPLRGGNEVEALVDGEKAFRSIARAVAEARRSVWLTVAFLEDGFTMPDGHGSLFDVLDRAVGRGLDVRVIFWRSEAQEEHQAGVHFFGTEAQRRALAERGSRFKARWDVLPGELCHHQKSWLVDAASPDEIAFVGGINLDPASVAEPGHPPRDEGNVHDVYVHSKIALVDDAWATIGSTNVADRSFRGDTEMNASFWHRPTVHALRVELLLEHLEVDSAHLDDAAAFGLYRERARKNAAARAQGRPLEGLAYEIDPARYGC